MKIIFEIEFGFADRKLGTIAINCILALLKGILRTCPSSFHFRQAKFLPGLELCYDENPFKYKSVSFPLASFRFKLCSCRFPRFCWYYSKEQMSRLHKRVPWIFCHTPLILLNTSVNMESKTFKEAVFFSFVFFVQSLERITQKNAYSLH